MITSWNIEKPTNLGEYLLKVKDLPTNEFHVAMAEVVQNGMLLASDFQPDRQQIVGYISVDELLSL